MPSSNKARGPPDDRSGRGIGARCAVAVAVPAALAPLAGPEAALAAAALGALAGFFDFLSRPKKERAANDEPGGEQARQGAAPEPAPDDGPAPPAGKLPGKEKQEPPRPRPRRSDYTGERVEVHVPGRKAGPPAAPPERPPDGERPAEPDAAVCPECRRPSDGPGRFCAECEATRFVTEVGNLISSLRTREVNVLPAERHLFQARSALAVSARKDVMRLAAQAEAAAREQEADFEESRRILSRCEETIATAIEAGRNTLAAEKAFRRATLLFKDGKYTDCMEEAVLIPAMIVDRPRPTIVPPGSAAGSAAGNYGDGAKIATGPAPEGAPAGGGEAGTAPAATGRCQSCGKRIGPGTDVCPSCGGPTARSGRPAWQGSRACSSCGEPLEPAWKVCPACNTPVEGGPEGADGNCQSCGREVLPTWSICPFCDAPLRQGDQAMKGRKGLVRPEKPVPKIPPALREKGVLEEIGAVDRLLDEAARRALDVRKARNLLELAVDFTRMGNYDKGERYVHKAKNVAETLLSIDGDPREP